MVPQMPLPAHCKGNFGKEDQISRTEKEALHVQTGSVGSGVCTAQGTTKLASGLDVAKKLPRPLRGAQLVQSAGNLPPDGQYGEEG